MTRLANVHNNTVSHCGTYRHAHVDAELHAYLHY